jgi:GYF domain 2
MELRSQPGPDFSGSEFVAKASLEIERGRGDCPMIACKLDVRGLSEAPMIQWFYARGGRRQGPVSFEELVNLAHIGEIHEEDLVWTISMKDWLPAGQVPGLIEPSPAAPETSFDDSPTDPAASNGVPSDSAGASFRSSGNSVLPEIQPGSDPLDALVCLKRGMELFKRNLPVLLSVTLAYLGINLLVGTGLHHLDLNMGWIEPQQQNVRPKTVEEALQQIKNSASPLSLVISNLLSLLLSMGFIRICLNLISGRDVRVGMLFGESARMPGAIAGLILYLTMIFVGSLMLVLPGIYLAVRYSYYLTAIVDRGMGVLPAFSYSASLTAGSRFSLFGLMAMCVIIAVAGALVYYVGLLFALPLAWLSFLTAYRWLQFGQRAAQDRPGTATPILTDV